MSVAKQYRALVFIFVDGPNWSFSVFPGHFRTGISQLYMVDLTKTENLDHFHPDKRNIKSVYVKVVVLKPKTMVSARCFDAGLKSSAKATQNSLKPRRQRYSYVAVVT